MGQILHGSAKTTHAVRAAIQRSKASIKELAGRYDLNPKTVTKWRKRPFVHDAAMGPEGTAFDGVERRGRSPRRCIPGSTRYCRWMTASTRSKPLSRI